MLSRRAPVCAPRAAAVTCHKSAPKRCADRQTYTASACRRGLRSAMYHLPFEGAGRFYRGNLHTHSTRSDGGLAPEAVVEAYCNHGYDFVALTDHFLARFGFPITDTRPLRSSDFTTILGAELHAPRTESGMDWHLVAVGLPLDFAATVEGETGPELARRAAASGAFVGIAHPAWYTLTPEDARSIEAADAIEVYNAGTSQWNDRGDAWYLCDLLLARGHRLNAYAADDAHFISARPMAFASWVQVHAPELTPEALLAALKAGDYYSSQGPELYNVAIAGGALSVACSPAQAIILSGPQAHARSLRGEGLDGATLSLEGFEGSYCRLTVIDHRGMRAWTNPIWLGE